MNRAMESSFLSTPTPEHTPEPALLSLCSHLAHAWLGADQGVAHSRAHRGACVSVQVRAAASTPAPPHDGAGVPYLSPKLFNGSVGAAGPLEPPAMNLCWNEIKKKSHSLR